MARQVGGQSLLGSDRPECPMGGTAKAMALLFNVSEVDSGAGLDAPRHCVSLDGQHRSRLTLRWWILLDLCPPNVHLLGIAADRG